jgi:murein DD-endopeptidase MepM/ murein hydrolase activator NlpD
MVEPSQRKPDRSLVVGLSAMAALVVAGVVLIVVSPSSREKKDDETSTQHPASTVDASNDAALEDASSEDAESDASLDPDASPSSAAKVPEPVWRVASFEGDPAKVLVKGVFGKRGLVQRLLDAGLERGEIRRVSHAFEGVHKIDRPREHDAFVFAKDKSTGALVAFEFVVSPFEVWQARVEDSSAERKLLAKRLELRVEHRTAAHSLVLSGDLAKTLNDARIRPEVVDAVDDALEGHIEGGALRSGARLRFLTTEDWVEGAFVNVHVDAVELAAKTGEPVRVYFYERERNASGASARRALSAGYFDARGRQPFRGQFRPPLALARVTSRFNPRRLHPVLKVVMPHQGVDFAGSTGTPVYAAASGTVLAASNAGPCGNMVEIDHGAGLATIYCHLRGFASGLKSGQKVESRQLIGYVGQTGRVTGPHLHFGVKRHGMFIDPLSLKMDGVRVLPPADRDPFQRRRVELDARLDRVAMPALTDAVDENDDKDLHAE